MDGEGDGIIGVGRIGQERREIMEKGQGKGTDTLQTNNVFTRKEYIERDAAIKAVEEADVMCDIDADAYRVLLRYIEKIPATDVIPEEAETLMRIKNAHIRICETCKQNYPECSADAKSVIIGTHDNFCACAHYVADVREVEHRGRLS